MVLVCLAEIREAEPIRLGQNAHAVQDRNEPAPFPPRFGVQIRGHPGNPYLRLRFPLVERPLAGVPFAFLMALGFGGGPRSPVRLSTSTRFGSALDLTCSFGGSE